MSIKVLLKIFLIVVTGSVMCAGNKCELKNVDIDDQMKLAGVYLNLKGLPNLDPIRLCQFRILAEAQPTNLVLALIQSYDILNETIRVLTNKQEQQIGDYSDVMAAFRVNTDIQNNINDLREVRNKIEIEVSERYKKIIICELMSTRDNDRVKFPLEGLRCVKQLIGDLKSAARIRDEMRLPSPVTVRFLGQFIQC